MFQETCAGSKRPLPHDAKCRIEIRTVPERWSIVIR
jgi:hypothetical protein